MRQAIEQLKFFQLLVCWALHWGKKKICYTAQPTWGNCTPYMGRNKQKPFLGCWNIIFQSLTQPCCNHLDSNPSFSPHTFTMSSWVSPWLSVTSDVNRNLGITSLNHPNGKHFLFLWIQLGNCLQPQNSLHSNPVGPWVVYTISFAVLTK